MRSITPTTLAIQKSSNYTPFVQVVIGNLTYRSNDPNSGLRLVETVEENLGYRATIELGLPTEFNPFVLEALVGQKVEISWGYVGGSYIRATPLRLLSVSGLSEPGQSVTRFNCVSWWELIANRRTVLDPSNAADYPPVWPKDTTIRNILAELLQSDAGVRSDNVDWLVRTYKPHYEADGLEAVLTTVRNLLDMTLSYIKLRPDGFHIVSPRAGDDVTYEYRLDDHTFFHRSHSYKIIIPNRIVVMPQLPTADEAPDFIGVAIDSNSRIQLGFLDFIIQDEGISTQGEANTRASVILNRLRAERTSGIIIAPMNIAQELYDMVRIYDIRTAPSLNIYRMVGRIRKTWSSEGVYEIELGLGGLTTHLSSLRTEYPISASTRPRGPVVTAPEVTVFGPPIPSWIGPPVSPWERIATQPPPVPVLTYPGGAYSPPVPDPIPYAPSPTPPGPTPTYRPPPTATPTPPPSPPDELPVSPWERGYSGSAQWSESSIPVLNSPLLDNVSGRTYGSAIQTPGALGGRRGRIEWFIPGIISSANPAGQRVKVTGGTWRIIRLTARVTKAPSSGPLYIYAYYTVPGGTGINIIMPPVSVMTIYSGSREATERTLRTGLTIPVGSLIEMAYVSAGTLGEDLTVELDYIVRATGQ